MTQPNGNVQSLAEQLHSLSIRVLRHARRADPESGLPPMQLSALSVLVGKGPQPLSKLAQEEQVRAPTMHTTVDTLAKKGLVTRARDKRDRRIVYVVATRAGSELLQSAKASRLSAIGEKLAALEPAALEAIAAALTQVEKLYD